MGELVSLLEQRQAFLERLRSASIHPSSCIVQAVREKLSIPFWEAFGFSVLTEPAEPVRNSETETLKRLLAPVQALAVPVRGMVSDVQTSLICAIAALWPQIPHQICQFHALRDASKVLVEEDGNAKRAVCRKLQPKLRAYRSDLVRRQVSASLAQCAQYDVLDR